MGCCISRWGTEVQDARRRRLLDIWSAVHLYGAGIPRQLLHPTEVQETRRRRLLDVK